MTSIFRAFFDYIRDSIAELRKVSWPSRQEVIRYTIIILISVAVAVLVVAAIDFALNYLVKEFLIK